NRLQGHKRKPWLIRRTHKLLACLWTAAGVGNCRVSAPLQAHVAIIEKTEHLASAGLQGGQFRIGIHDSIPELRCFFKDSLVGVLATINDALKSLPASAEHDINVVLNHLLRDGAQTSLRLPFFEALPHLGRSVTAAHAYM